MNTDPVDELITTPQHKELLSAVAKVNAMQEKFEATLRPMEIAVERAHSLLPDTSDVDALVKKSQEIYEEIMPDMKPFEEIEQKAQDWSKTIKSFESNKQESSSLPVFIPRENPYQKPMAPEDRELIVQALSKKINPEENSESSIFDWNTLDIVIEGKRIKLVGKEKSICSFIFKRHPKKYFLISELEEAVYEGNPSGSKGPKQAIVRINGKIREAGFSNIFRREDEMLYLLV